MGDTGKPYTGDGWPPVRKLWPDAVVAIFGAGPSLTQAQVEQTRGACQTIAVNLAYRLAPWADLLYACDSN